MSEKTEPLRMRTPEFRASFVKVFKPEFNELSKADEYSLDALFSKEDNDMKDFKKLMERALLQKWPDKEKWKKLKLKTDCIKDGDEKEGDELYAGHWYIKLRSRTKPKVVGTKRDEDKNFIELGEDEFGSGDFARAMVTCSAFDKNGGRGVTFYLGNIQKMRDGDRLGGGNSNPNVDFDDIEESDDDTDSDDDGFGF